MRVLCWVVRVRPLAFVKTLSLKLPFPVLGLDIYQAALRLCPQGQTVLRRYFKTQACQPAHQPRQRRWRQLDVQNKTALIAVYLLSCQVSRMVVGDGQTSGPASMLAKQVATKVGLPHVTRNSSLNSRVVDQPWPTQWTKERKLEEHTGRPLR